MSMIGRISASMLIAAVLTLSALAGPLDKDSVRKGPSGLEIPRFVALNAPEVNMRAGPGLQYPIEWVFRRRSLPMLVTDEYDNWRKVRDPDGVEGWIHVQLLTGKRSLMVEGTTRRLYARPDATSALIMTAEAGVVGTLIACRNGWCEMRLEGRRGWIRQVESYGSFTSE